MILVDGATGSAELVEPLRRMRLPVEQTHLDFGDVAVIGRGVKGVSLFIGIELKKIGELVQSMNSARLQGHQLRGMIAAYDRRYLIVEGDFHHDKHGRAVMARGRRSGLLRGAPSAMDFEKRLLNLQVRGGLITRHVSTRRDTLRVICAWYRYWTDRDLDAHKSHIAIYAPDLDRALCVPVSDFRKGLVAACPGLGFAMSGVIEKRVWDDKKGEGSWRRLGLLAAKDFAELATTDRHGKTKRIGPSRAQDIMEAIR